MATKLRLTTKGFAQFEQALKVAEEKAVKVVTDAMQKAAKDFTQEIRAGAEARELPQESLNAIMEPIVKNEHNVISCTAGFKLGEYGDGDGGGYIALYTEYGTPHRNKYGRQQPDPFIAPARDKAAKAYKNEVKKGLNKILEEAVPK
jgi:hypothetical protein